MPTYEHDAQASVFLRSLPALNALLNSISWVLLSAGYVCVRRKAIAAHKACMLAALVVSGMFLTSYLIYHYHAGSRPFTGQGPVRVVYFAILISHVVLAVATLPLALVTAYRGLRGRIESHRRIARWTLPIWWYVSMTGVLVYFMLYHWFPTAATAASHAYTRG